MNLPSSLASAAIVLCMLSCAGPAPGVERGVERPLAEIPEQDLVEEEGGKADGAWFDPSHLIDDAAFTDAGYLSAGDIQRFLEDDPYGGRSFLADWAVDGGTVAEALVRAAREHDISPLVLLVKLQVEMGLVSRTTPATVYRIDYAMGCGCLDGRGCLPVYRGLGVQLDCAAERLRSYLAEIEVRGRTTSGWAVGSPSISVDHVTVTPGNAATAALYTYTPWVLRGEGGNWLFWNVYRKYARHALKERTNHRWIGGLCDDSTGCGFSGAQCVPTDGGGLCTRPCLRMCPDSTEPSTAVTFCVDLGVEVAGAHTGHCVSRCDDALFSDNDGCHTGFSCTDADRYGDPETSRRVCLATPTN